MKLLLTNDDGFDAPGLDALLKAAEGLGECVVLAPRQPLSGCSHQVTTHEPLRVERRGLSRYSLSGTPADCVRIGLRQLVPDAGCVLSGINQGGNLGSDVFYSGTVAAVREGVLQAPWSAGTFWNINLPHPEPGRGAPRTVRCPLDVSPLPVTFREEAEGFLYDGDYHQRQYRPGTDVDACFRGDIALTQVRLK